MSSLLAGLAVMARRPPLLALADGGGTDDLVKVRAAARFDPAGDPRPDPRAVGRARARAAASAGGRVGRARELARSRDELAAAASAFAELERQRMRAVARRGRRRRSAAGDVAMAAGESVDQLRGEQSNSASARALAEQLAAEDAAPPRPFGAGGSGRDRHSPIAPGRCAGRRGAGRGQRQRRALARRDASPPARRSGRRAGRRHRPLLGPVPRL